MKNYERIDFNKVENEEDYLLYKVVTGHAIIVIAVDESKNCIDDLTSYANAKDNKDSWLSSLLAENQKLKDFVISQSMTPSYETDMERYIDIYSDSQNIYTFEEFKRKIQDMKQSLFGDSANSSGENDESFRYECYVSLEKCDIGNFGASLECEFCEEWVADNGWKK